MGSAKANGYFYFILATIFVFFAISYHNRIGEWSIITLLIIGVATIDYMISFRYFGKAGKEKNKKNE
ncbi:DUF4305 domain-containing protein [Evansella sp. AB-P1]|uniref:DUF4305 domain-containing protein n=1 Tax=Evansella sp. AB-P1 TaxID=3037653 RepID=UPI00241F4FFA|nr:DUF4305 domain-containing protein [Evansella sp. AB-P1]MDG5785871.1 DUF4305 domain-containing protein [Evansella sp. AB-P1]